MHKQSPALLPFPFHCPGMPHSSAFFPCFWSPFWPSPNPSTSIRSSSSSSNVSSSLRRAGAVVCRGVWGGSGSFSLPSSVFLSGLLSLPFGDGFLGASCSSSDKSPAKGSSTSSKLNFLYCREVGGDESGFLSISGADSPFSGAGIFPEVFTAPSEVLNFPGPFVAAFPSPELGFDIPRRSASMSSISFRVCSTACGSASEILDPSAASMSSAGSLLKKSSSRNDFLLACKLLPRALPLLTPAG